MLTNWEQAEAVACDASASLCRYDEGVLNPHHSDARNPSLGFKGDDHPFYEWLVEALGDAWRLVHLQANPMPKEVGPRTTSASTWITSRVPTHGWATS